MRNRLLSSLPVFRERFLAVGLLILLALVASGCNLEVQPIEQYTSEDGFLSVTFPAAWDVLDDFSSDGMTTVLVGSHQELLDSSDVPPDASGVFVGILPDAVADVMLEADVESAKQLLTMMHDDFGNDPNQELGDIEDVELDGGTQAYRFLFQDDFASGYMYTLAVADGVYVMSAVLAPSDGGANAETVAEEVLASVKLVGDSDEFIERGQKAVAGY